MRKRYDYAEIVLTSAQADHRNRRPAVTSEDVARALRSRGGVATRRQLAEALSAPAWNLARRLEDLLAQGRVERRGHGVYRLVDEPPEDLLGGSAADVVRAIGASGAEAHLTGLDPIAAHSHQFLRSFPHLVYADPGALDQMAFALSQAGFQPVRAGRAARDTLVHAPDPDRIVLLRGQPTSRMDRLGVRSEVAPPEKAWLDLLREARTGALPISLTEVGAILSSLLRSGGGDARQLLRWAREMGYDRQTRAVLDPETAERSNDDELRQLAAGARQ